ncbi:MAG TPA: DUF5683 domain-containing protein [Bacteroidales bacterium]|nr:DUF5683 domain-containing protein [Bacteroidales bacterium]
MSLLFLIALLYFGGGKNDLMAAETDTTLVATKAATISGSVQKVNPALVKDSIYKPDPKKAIWYSVLCPGLGQLYNRRYWKLPFVGAGVIGVAYAINWNSKYYNAYTNGYRDIMDDDPNTKSYLKLLAADSNYPESQLANTLKNSQQKFRRSRDLSYIGAVGVYVICILDAFVDAQLYDFDISPDLSLTPSAPRINQYGGAKAVEFSLAFRF